MRILLKKSDNLFSKSWKAPNPQGYSLNDDKYLFHSYFFILILRSRE